MMCKLIETGEFQKLQILQGLSGRKNWVEIPNDEICPPKLIQVKEKYIDS